MSRNRTEGFADYEGAIVIEGRSVYVMANGRGGSTPQGGPDPLELTDWEFSWDDNDKEFTEAEYDKWEEYILENCHLKPVPWDL